MCFPLDYKAIRICTVLELLCVFSQYVSDRSVDKRMNTEHTDFVWLRSLAEYLLLLEGHFQDVIRPVVEW